MGKAAVLAVGQVTRHLSQRQTMPFKVLSLNACRNSCSLLFVVLGGHCRVE